MTLLPSPLAQSTLGEKAAFYLDHVTDHTADFFVSLRPRLEPFLTYLSAAPFRSVARALPFDADERTTALCAAILVCVLTVAAMSWGNSFSNIWRRSPAFPSPPQVSDADFSYITPDDIVDPPSNASRYSGQYNAADADETEPDIICLRHRGTIYPLHFPAYAIDDGVLTVGALRQEAAAKMGAGNPNQVRLLYKGTLLKDDHRTCKAEGLKQHSEVLCVVSEVPNTPSDLSDSNDSLVQRPGSSSSRVDGEEAEPGVSAPPDKPKKKNNNKKKIREKKKAAAQESMLGTPPSAVPSRPTSTGSSNLPPPAPNLKTLPNALEQVTALTGYLQQVLIPLCNEYVADPPAELRKREFEYKKLSETILAQVMLNADGIEPNGDVGIRNARKALIKEAQATLNRLDSIERQ
ncbi:uncharacterized protein N7459_004881 [Penicillium hispanicum]|uniref:uncharacterized protein n=1 Tax=Penicillium hispanicum TaxID=1080232 RepID=UPI00253FE8C3|nr:uncharacterized protein N7459_004881 [Penicillium hispanicum]KAJ5585081.1 hypothetical protein N7459_004881 [Penicillium hispanicum]